MLHAVTFMWVKPRNDGEVPIATTWFLSPAMDSRISVSRSWGNWSPTDAIDGFPRLVMIWSNEFWKLMEMDFYKDLGTFSSWNDPSDSVEKNENHPQEATVQLRMSGLLFAHHPCKAMSYIWLYLMGNISGYIWLYHPVEGKLVTSDYSCDCEPLWPWILVADDLAPPKKMEQSRMLAMAFSQDNFPGFPLFMRRLP